MNAYVVVNLITIRSRSRRPPNPLQSSMFRIYLLFFFSLVVLLTFAHFPRLIIVFVASYMVYIVCRNIVIVMNTAEIQHILG